jgi:hypothetical protein
MSTNIIKKARVNEVDALQKLADGLTQHASTAPAVVLAGVTLKPSDVVAKLQARIAQAKAVSSAAANWHSTVQTDQTAAAQLKPVLSAVKQVLLAAYSTQLDVLADFGLSPRKKPVVSPATRTAAALKAKATRAARGTKGTQQKAAITTQVTIAPATMTAVPSGTHRALGPTDRQGPAQLHRPRQPHHGLPLPQPAQALSSFDGVKLTGGAPVTPAGLVPLPTPCIGQGSSRGPATGPSTITVTTERRRALRACAMLYGLLVAAFLAVRVQGENSQKKQFRMSSNYAITTLEQRREVMVNVFL